jgi:hypothetical protein
MSFTISNGAKVFFIIFGIAHSKSGFLVWFSAAIDSPFKFKRLRYLPRGFGGLNGLGEVKTFAVANPEDLRIMRIGQIGVNSSGNHLFGFEID